MKYMLDTNICIYAITYGELMHGVEKSQSIEKKRIAPTLFLSPITILEYRRFYGKEKLLANHFNLSASQLKVRTVNFQGDKQIISLFRFFGEGLPSYPFYAAPSNSSYSISCIIYKKTINNPE